ncbi:MAG: site-specific DNA-methyltransferase [Armatimonadetes bacterium]|nr:site-specific DNA-methyltransferase [Armatimonadota bacterium]
MLPEVPVIASAFSQDSRLVILESDTEVACRSLPREFFQLIITSPPYNIGKAYERQATLKEYLAWQRGVIEQLATLLGPRGSICWQVGNYVDDGEVFPLDSYFYPIFKELGFRLRNRVIWHFGHGLHASKRFSGRYETLSWFTKTGTYVFNLDSVRVPSKYPGKTHHKGEKRGLPSGNSLGKNPSDFWEFLADEWETGLWKIPNVKSNHCEKTIHPCQFPVELVERCVLALTNEDDWVLDPFMGVGSALIGAAKHDRKAVGIDRDREYCRVARKRLASLYAGSLKLRPVGRPVHEPTGRERVAQLPLQWLEQDRGPK